MKLKFTPLSAQRTGHFQQRTGHFQMETSARHPGAVLLKVVARALHTYSAAAVQLEPLKTLKWLYIALDRQTPRTTPLETTRAEFAYDESESSMIISSESLTGSSGSPVTAMTLMVIFSESTSTRQ